MTRILRLLSFVGMLALIVTQAGMAHAQATRTWISGVGDDANPCSRTAPCKTFAGAISKTAAGGIINCLDPGGFGAVTITKSITFNCTATLGSILVSGTSGIVINAGATDVITLRGLDIVGAGPPGNTGIIGVSFLNGGVLHIENCKISGFTSGSAAGVLFQPAGSARLFISDSQINDNGTGSTGGGLVVRPVSGAFAKVTVRHSEFSGNTAGVVADGSGGGFASHIQAVDTVSAGNTGAGFTATGTNTSLFLDRVSSVHNGAAGVLVNGSTAQALITNSTIADNALGVSITGGATAFTYATSQINGNAGSDGTPLPHGLMQQ